MTWFFFSASGRLSRGPYALGILFWFSLLIAAVGLLLGGYRVNSDAQLILGLLSMILAGLFTVASMAIMTIKRAHDLGHPGIVAFAIFIPVVSFFALLFFLLLPSSPPNDYGRHSNQPQ